MAHGFGAETLLMKGEMYELGTLHRVRMDRDAHLLGAIVRVEFLVFCVCEDAVSGSDTRVKLEATKRTWKQCCFVNVSSME